MNSPSESRLLLRLPAELKTRVEQSAVENRRSMNKEIQVALERYVAAQMESR
jgi:predicted transcriptional regulator